MKGRDVARDHLGIALAASDDMDLLREIFEYRSLSMRRMVLRAALCPDELARLAELSHRFEIPDASGPSVSHVDRRRRRHVRFGVHLPAIAAIDRRREPVCILNLGGGGLVVTKLPCVRRGDLIEVAATDEGRGRSLRFAAQVVRELASGHGLAMGCAFQGVPVSEVLEGGDARWIAPTRSQS